MEYPRFLQKLGDLTIIEHVLSLARALVPPEDVHIIVGYQRESVEQFLGSEYNYVLQPEPLGTGHAVLQMQPVLAGYKGQLLILDGDTPLFRLASLRGMLLRHRLKGAQMTLFSAVTDSPLPYGRVVRDKEERITSVVEGSVAEAAELAAGDIVRSAAGEDVARNAELIAIVQRQAPGTWLPLGIERDGDRLEFIAKFPPESE